MLFPEAMDQSVKDKIKNLPFYKKPLMQLEKDRKHYLKTPMPPLPFNLYKLFYTDGDRRKYEDIYFERRGRLTAFVMAVLLYGRKEDITALEDTVWDICNEYTWVLPAHMPETKDGYDLSRIDLFSAETGFALAEIYYLLGDTLDRKVTNRILRELERRIFTPYENNTYWWEESLNNWAAVCAGSVGAAYIYTAPKRFEKVRKRIDKTLGFFLSGFGDDGVCVEGIGYWNYGFGYFTYYAQLLKEFSSGKYDLFAAVKCKNIALFQQNAFLRKNYTLSFSDGYQKWCYLPGLTQKLYEIYGSDVTAPLSKYAEFDEYCHRFPMYLRNFFWSASAPAVMHKSSRPGEKYYSDAQWYILNRSRLSLAAKAGHNDEPHNHNDIGSFALLGDDGYILCDYGCGEYSRAYFDPKERYTFLCNSSRGHNLPLINGMEQAAGKEYHGTVLKAENGEFSADIAKAYPKTCGIEKLIRSITLSADNTFMLKDSFKFKKTGNTVTERFVTTKKPVLTDNTVTIGNYRLIYDDTLRPSVTSEKLLDHFAKEDLLYMIDFRLDDPSEFEISMILNTSD